MEAVAVQAEGRECMHSPTIMVNTKTMISWILMNTAATHTLTQTFIRARSQPHSVCHGDLNQAEDEAATSANRTRTLSSNRTFQIDEEIASGLRYDDFGFELSLT